MTATGRGGSARAAAVAVERDICLLYHQLADAPTFCGQPAPFLEQLDFTAVFTLPYWEYLAIEGIDSAQREFIGEGCLVMMMMMALDALEDAESACRGKLPLCRAAVERAGVERDGPRRLAQLVLAFIDATERPGGAVSEELQELSVQVLEDHVWRYFRRRARRPRSPPFFRDDDPVKAERRKIDWYVKLADEAYDRLYKASSGTEAAAAHCDCTESISEAIALARRTGLDEKALELKRKRAHCDAVFRSQFGGLG